MYLIKIKWFMKGMSITIWNCNFICFIVFICFSEMLFASDMLFAKEGLKKNSLKTDKPRIVNAPLKNPSLKDGVNNHSISHLIEKSIVQSGVSKHQLGIIVASSESIFYQLNEDKKFIPASLAKILTASALLELLKPSLTFNTGFLATKKVKGSILPGNLYLKGGGDPGFVSESLWNLVNNLTRTGVKVIEGDLIVDDSRFDKQRRQSRLSKASHFSYDAPVGALSFNWNTANIYIRPIKKNTPLKITIDPVSSYFSSIDNRTKTLNSSKKKRNIIIQRKKDKDKDKESLKITGSLPIHHKEVLIYRNILYPELWTGWNAIEFLKQRDIKVKGTVRRGRVPKSAKVLAHWESRPLTDYITLMMKYSNNFMVEMLVKNMVVELKNKPGNLNDGLDIMRNYLKTKGIKKHEYILEQASGLSRKNQLQVKHLLKILRYWLNHPLQPEFESAFPLSGEDGTLKKYFVNDELNAQVHAKTGSINGVVGLAGYMVNQKKEKKIFIFLFNGSQTLRKKIESLFKKWTYIIWKSYPSTSA